MAESTTIVGPRLVEALDRLAQFESAEFPVVSLYLDTRPDTRGRDHWQPFVRKELPARAETFPRRSPARESLEADVERIERFLREALPASANGVAIFACSAGGLFEALPVDAPIEENRLSVGTRPHLYPLARLIDEYPRFAVVVADTQTARILVFARGRRIDTREVEGRRTRRTQMGGWAQMRYQRHVDEIRQHNVREIVSALERVVREDRVDQVVLAGDEEAVPMLREELSPALASRVVDVLRLDVRTPEKEILEEALGSIRLHDAKTDAERIRRALDEYRGGGLAVVGPEDVEAALSAGQVDELLISATLSPPADAAAGRGAPGSSNATRRAGRDSDATRLTAEIADELVAKARQTSARVTFIENPDLLAECGGVAASLRFRFAGTGLEKNP
jgi:peptide chain release factor subunit 1